MNETTDGSEVEAVREVRSIGSQKPLDVALRFNDCIICELRLSAYADFDLHLATHSMAEIIAKNLGGHLISPTYSVDKETGQRL